MGFTQIRQKAADHEKQSNVLPSLKKSATLAKKLKSLQKNISRLGIKFQDNIFCS
jgi:hypothetical protein